MTRILPGILLLILFLSLESTATFGMIDPRYKECMQRGYEVSGDYCVFPDGSRCNIDSFNSGACGAEWMTENYCISEGVAVWDEELCCEGLIAYLPSGTAGQAKCTSIVEATENEFVLNWITWVSLILIIAATILYRRYGKKPKSTT